MIAIAGYSASYNSSIKTHAKDTYMSFKPDEKAEFEKANSCCGFDVVEEGSPKCVYKVPCGTTMEKTIQKYPQMAVMIGGLGAVILVSLLFVYFFT